MDDPYRTLGVERDASLAEIKQAYRRLAKELHPDTNPGNAEALERFKLLSAAYDILTDPERRARYERGRTGSTWGGGFEGFDGPRHDDVLFDDEAFGRGDSLGDLFGDIAGNRRGRGGTSMWLKGEDMAETVRLSFAEAAVGAEREITRFNLETVMVAIPAGVTSGDTVTLPQLGFPGFGGGPAGDLNVIVEVEPHPVLRRAVFDVTMALPVSDALRHAGGRVRVPTITGEVALRIPAGARLGDELILDGMGFKDPVSGRRGVQRVRLVADERPS